MVIIKKPTLLSTNYQPIEFYKAKMKTLEK